MCAKLQLLSAPLVGCLWLRTPATTSANQWTKWKLLVYFTTDVGQNIKLSSLASLMRATVLRKLEYGLHVGCPILDPKLKRMDKILRIRLVVQHLKHWEKPSNTTSDSGIPQHFHEESVHSFFIRTSNFWLRLNVLKYFRDTSLKCS